MLKSSAESPPWANDSRVPPGPEAQLCGCRADSDDDPATRYAHRQVMVTTLFHLGGPTKAGNAAGVGGAMFSFAQSAARQFVSAGERSRI